ncbi:MAG: hypothetical protein AB7K63_18185 [Vicinamibacterales bacterium]
MKTVERSAAIIVTAAQFRRPVNPKRCNVHRFHVFRWTTTEFDQETKPPTGTKCQCGCLTWGED